MAGKDRFIDELNHFRGRLVEATLASQGVEMQPSYRDIGIDETAQEFAKRIGIETNAPHPPKSFTGYLIALSAVPAAMKGISLVPIEPATIVFLIDYVFTQGRQASGALVTGMAAVWSGVVQLPDIAGQVAAWVRALLAPLLALGVLLALFSMRKFLTSVRHFVLVVSKDPLRLIALLVVLLISLLIIASVV